MPILPNSSSLSKSSLPFKKNMRAQSVPPTVLDKWRRKAFELTNELYEMEMNNQKESSQFAAAESALSQKVADMKASISATTKANTKLEGEQKCVESQISVLQKHLGALDSQAQIATDRYGEIVQIGERYMKTKTPEVTSVASELKTLQELVDRLRAITVPKKPKKWTHLENQVRELTRQLSDKKRQSEEQKAAISIYRKLVAAQRKYHQLGVQMKGIEAEIQRENDERMHEQELRDQLVNMKEQAKRDLNEREVQMRQAYEAKKLERDKIERQKKNLQVEMENAKLKTESAQEEATVRVRDCEETLARQAKEIEELQHKVTVMELSLRFEKETNTEQERPQIFELDPPRKPAPQVPTAPTSSRTSSTAAKLDALWQAAKETVKDQAFF